MKTRILHSSGFTLIETLVAISILVVIVSGALAVTRDGISSYILSRDQVTAFYLAAEGVEMIRNARDENSLRSINWLSGVSQASSDPCYFGKKCMVDAVTDTITACASSCPFIRYDSTSGLYGYSGSWAETNFRREITLTQINSNEVSILVSVKWGKGVVEREFKVRENILNWQ